MKFTQTKLPKDAIQNLRRVPVGEFKPNTVTPAPVYVYLERNQKFVSVKSQLGFFTEAELAKLAPYENLYLAALVDVVAPFCKAGAAVKSLLQLREVHNVQTKDGKAVVKLPPAPHELGDSVARLIGPLWARGTKLEPFFLSFFADEVCGPIDAATLGQIHDQSVDACELAYLRSSTAVFLALHVGFTEPARLASIRARAFVEIFQPASDNVPVNINEQVLLLARSLITDPDTREITPEAISKIGGAAAAKIIARLDRIGLEFIDHQAEPPSLYGKNGVIRE